MNIENTTRKAIYAKAKKLLSGQTDLAKQDIEQFFAHGDEVLDAWILRALGATGKKNHYSLIVRYIQSPSILVRAAAASALGSITDRRGIPHLRKLYADKCSFIRWEAILALITLQTKEVIDLYIAELRHEDAYIRLKCAEVLGELPDKRSVGPLHTCCADPATDVRITAMRSLVAIGSDDSLRFFTKALQDTDPYVRSHALIGLAKKPDANLFTIAKTMIADGHDIVRMATTKALEACGDAEAVVQLERLCKDRSAKVRSNAILSLGHIGSYAQLTLLSQLAESQSPSTQAAVAEALGYMGYSESLTILTELVKSRNKHVKGVAASAIFRFDEGFLTPGKTLNKHGINTALEELQSGELLRAREVMRSLTNSDIRSIASPVLKHIAHQDLEVSRNAIRALINNKVKGILAKLSEQLSSPYLMIRSELAGALHYLRNQAEYQNHWRSMCGDTCPSLRAHAVLQMTLFRPENLAHFLSGRGKDKSEVVRWATLFAFLRDTEGDSSAALKRMLKDKNEDIAFYASVELTRTGTRMQSINAILLRYLKHKEPEMRKKAAAALALIQPTSGGNLLKEHLFDSEVQVRRSIALAMQKVKEHTAAAPLVKALSDKDVQVCVAALRALMQHKQHDLTNALKLALKSSEPTVISAAVELIVHQKIEGFTKEILALLNSRKPEVRHAALLAIEPLRLKKTALPQLFALFRVEKNMDNKALITHIICSCPESPDIAAFIQEQLKSPIKAVREACRARIYGIP